MNPFLLGLIIGAMWVLSFWWVWAGLDEDDRATARAEKGFCLFLFGIAPIWMIIDLIQLFNRRRKP